MKRLITSVAVLLALGSSAFAMTPQNELSASTIREARQFVPNADFSDLTSSQALAIANAVHGDREHIGSLLRSILMQN